MGSHGTKPQKLAITVEVTIPNLCAGYDSERYLPSRGEFLLLIVDDIGLEDLARLLSLSLAEVHVVDVDERDVTLVSWDHGSLSVCGTLMNTDKIKQKNSVRSKIYCVHSTARASTCTVCQSDLSSKFFIASLRRELDQIAYLGGHVVVRGPIEVRVGPTGELLFLKLLCCTVILERELSVRLKELGNLHLLFNTIYEVTVEHPLIFQSKLSLAKHPL